MTIVEIKDKALWDGFIDSSDYGSIYHKWDFLEIIKKYSKIKLYRYGIYDGADLIAVFPMFIDSIMGFQVIYSPPPGLAVPYLGFVPSYDYDGLSQEKREDVLDIIADSINFEINKLSPKYISICGLPKMPDVRNFLFYGYYANAHYNYLIDLKKPLEQLWESLSKDCRKRIMSMSRSTSEIKEVSDIEKFYNIMKKRYNQQGLNFSIPGPGYIKDLIEAYPDNIKLFFIYDNGKTSDVELICQYKDKITLWMGGAIIEKSLHSQEYATWKLIEMYKGLGYSQLEISGADIKRLCRFQSKFNPSLNFGYKIYKKDAIGSFSEWFYLSFIKKRWLNTGFSLEKMLIIDHEIFNIYHKF
jgi:hypothetical protein